MKKVTVNRKGKSDKQHGMLEIGRQLSTVLNLKKNLLVYHRRKVRKLTILLFGVSNVGKTTVGITLPWKIL